MGKIEARFLAFDLSTTALSCGCRSHNGSVEDFISIPVRGATLWEGQPAFDLSFVPGMIFDALEELQRRGWNFRGAKRGTLSFSVRQHDMVPLGEDDKPIIPALSWQCNVAGKESAELNNTPQVLMHLGKIEPRFILAKLLWVMRNFPDIDDKIKTVLTTGDWISACLTGNFRLSTSDGLSNGLLDQRTKQKPETPLLNKDFFDVFPLSIQSGQEVGIVSPTLPPNMEAWAPIVRLLQYWTVISSLGDNHAGAVGCGLADYQTIVISAGTSGTVVRACPSHVSLRGRASCFEYYDDRLLLMMLADCAAWFVKFASWYYNGAKPNFAELDRLALSTPPDRLQFLSAENRNALIQGDMLRDILVPANAQFSIAVELLDLVKAMTREVPGEASQIKRFVLTGGMSKSPFFQEVMRTGLGLIQKDAEVLVSNREGPLASQAATLGVMINAMVGSGFYKSLAQAASAMCPLRPAAAPEPCRLESLQATIKRVLGIR